MLKGTKTEMRNPVVADAATPQELLVAEQWKLSVCTLNTRTLLSKVRASKQK